MAFNRFARARKPIRAGRAEERLGADISHVQHGLDSPRQKSLNRQVFAQADKRTVLMGQNGAKSAPDAIKPFGNSQKGNGKGWLTWLVASDKYPPIR